MAESLAQLATWILPSAALPIALPSLSPLKEWGRLQKLGLDATDLCPLLLNWLGHHPPWKQHLLRPKFPGDWRWEMKAVGGVLSMGSRGVLMTTDLMDDRDILWRNSCVRRWLWISAYKRGSALVTRLVTKSLNSSRRPWNTYKLKSSNDTDRPVATNSSNKALPFCINWVTDSSPCRRSWREP